VLVIQSSPAAGRFGEGLTGESLRVALGSPPAAHDSQSRGLSNSSRSGVQFRPRQRLYSRRYAYHSAFHRALPAFTCDRPPSGSNWIHEIKHDGYRPMARRDSVGIRLITRRGNDWSDRFPLVVEAVNHLKVRSCLIDGEVVCCDKRGLATFQLLRHRRNEPQAFLYAFDLLELNGEDRRKEPLRGPQGNAGEHPTQESARGTSR
jgi:hypothetical protein